ncbi:Aste57867_1417 [Aphanomyces stellatus]|uniref:Aste57867_1417 protein n=1 Tax=Aphanomyces stellatus TaxID=120398 RepID=A0A485K679_9STRA|nr:hypothetical protein As57867_001416 [Aphanomyces stellatus]VFT78634.1 Aste57867_1417 [Aphanomyces stellatus]
MESDDDRRHNEKKKSNGVGWHALPSTWMCVLGSPTLMSAIATFQRGVFADMMGLLDLECNVPTMAQLNKTIRDAQALLAPWLLMHGTTRLLKLFACFDVNVLVPVVVIHAISTSDAPLLGFLVAHVNPNLLLSGRVSFVDVAAMLNNLAALRLLYGTARCSSRAFDYAVEHGNLEMVQFLHTNSSPTERFSARAVMLAATHGHLEVLAYLLQHGMPQRGEIFDMVAGNGHLDILDFLIEQGWNATDACAAAAAKFGHLGVLHWLRDHPPPDGSLQFGTAMVAAAEFGHMACLEFLLALYPRFYIPELYKLDRVAANGHLQVLHCLHTRGGTCTTLAMDRAAGNGHLDVVQWLHVNRTEGCTVEAMDLAATNNHMDVVGFLLQARIERCSTNAMDGAASNGHLAMVQWLHEHTNAGCTTDAVDFAARDNHWKVVQWLLANRSEGCSDRAPLLAAQMGHSAMAKWLLETCTLKCEVDVAAAVARHGDVDVVSWLVQEYPHVAQPLLLESASMRGHVALVKWLLVHVSVGCPNCTLQVVGQRYRRVHRALEDAAANKDRWCLACKHGPPRSKTPMSVTRKSKINPI